VRLGDQLNYYTLKTERLDKDLSKWRVWIILYGALGTLLVATGAEFWLPLTAAIVAALTAFLEYQQTEQTLVKYNQTLNNLVNLKAWWISLSEEEKKKPGNIVYLVEHSEQILGTEQSGWVREMQSAMQRQRERDLCLRHTYQALSRAGQHGAGRHGQVQADGTGKVFPTGH
jgi:hypothetical protein